MARTILTDELWAQLQKTMKQHGCYISPKTRTITEAILWKLRTGGPWRDIPEELVSWKTAYNRFNRWSENGLWEKFFYSLRNPSRYPQTQDGKGANIGFDRYLYKLRHLIENLFARLKQFRSIVTWYEKF